MIKQPFDWETFSASLSCLVFFSSAEDVLDFERECDKRHISFGLPFSALLEIPWPIYKRYHDGMYMCCGSECYAQQNFPHTYAWLEYNMPHIPDLDDLI